MESASTRRLERPEALPPPPRRPGRSALDAVSDFIEHTNPLVIAVLATLVHALLYGVPNHFPLAPARELPVTPLDRAVPFLPWTVWIYLSDYLLAFVALVATSRSPGGRTRFVGAFFAAVCIATATHWLFPTVYPRGRFPIPADADTTAALGLFILRRVDSPLSCFPSLHVATSLIAAMAVWTDGTKRLGALCFAWAMLVALATLTAKQHYAIDVVGGAALALLAHAAFHLHLRNSQPYGARL